MQSSYSKSDFKSSPFYFPIKRPVAISMIVLTVVVFGFLSYRLLPIRMMPEISYPSLTVRTQYPGAAPEEVENSVTRPIEQSLGIVRNLVEISSSSRAEISDVLLQFDWGTDMNRATQDVREKLDVVFLSDDVKPPLILRYDPSLDPLMRIGLTSDSLDLLQIRELSEELVKRELEKLPGVAVVKVKGGEEAEIRVSLNAAKISLLRIPMSTIWRRLAAENVNVAGGILQDGEAEFIIRTLNEFRTVEEIANIVIDQQSGQPIRLSDVAQVNRTTMERTEMTRVDGRESVELEIYKESDANPITVSKLVRLRFFGDESLKKRQFSIFNKKDTQKRHGPLTLSETLTERVKPQVLADQAEFIKLSIDEVRSAAILGGILAVIVLLIFLGRLRDTIVVALVIPVSLLCAFAAMHMMKVTLNLMSLGGLALGIGMMVDNAIVVIESIYRRRELGDEPIKAAVIGTRTVGGAVIASTLTTVVVFFPIVFVSGVAGQVFGDMALTVIMALLGSLFVALFLIPMLLTRGELRKEVQSNGTSWRRSTYSYKDTWDDFKTGFNHPRITNLIVKVFLFPLIAAYVLTRLIISLLIVTISLLTYALMLLLRAGFKRIVSPSADKVGGVGGRIGKYLQDWFARFSELYGRFIGNLIKHPAPVIMAALVLLAISYGVLFKRLGAELIPNVSQGAFEVEIALPVGTTLAETASTILPIEESLYEIAGVRKVSSRIGGDLFTSEEKTRGPHNATIAVLLQSGGDLDRREAEVVEVIRKISAGIPALDYKITHTTIFTIRRPIEIIIKEDDLQKLKLTAGKVEKSLRDLPELVDVESSVRRGRPEVAVIFNRDKLARLGLSARDAAEQVRGAIQGRIPTKFREEAINIDIRVQLSKTDRETTADLERIVINTGQTVPVTLSDVAFLDFREGPSEIRRVGGARAAVISCGINEGDLKSADAAIRNVMNDLGLFPGYDYDIAGQHREMQSSIGSLQFALLLAIFLVYVVMASQFESLLHPFLILLTVPIALAGVIPALWLLGQSISVMVFLGLIVLTGIVVNNSIVLVDYSNQLRHRSNDLDSSIVEAARSRLRPILMTSLTTILALLPMALGVGEGVEIRRPMAITVIFGLSFATLVTLIFIPVVYRLITPRLREKIKLKDKYRRV